ncbi:MAG: hypothetical protein A4E57_04904 [Syntrophorhabdaceae bacterium PtaU1.Bin034]|nr:MAG: hypothetical protein A4E57_04904 [Syntrophorhabdaceae bacterium PtaU1.Bin034]
MRHNPDQFIDVDARKGRRHQAKIRERGIPAADVFEIQKDPAVAAFFGRPGEWSVGVRYGNEVLSRFLPLNLPHPVKKIVLKSERLGRGTRFARHDEECGGDMHLLFETGYGKWVRSIENGKRKSLRTRLKHMLEYKGRQAAAAHAHVHNVGKARGLDLFCEELQVGNLVLHLFNYIKPSKGVPYPLLLLRIGLPETRVLLP